MIMTTKKQGCMYCGSKNITYTYEEIDWEHNCVEMSYECDECGKKGDELHNIVFTINVTDDVQ